MSDGLQPLALMGGTFDPVHYGHLRCAEEARRKLQLDTLYLLPAGEPPHRPTPVASPGQRLAMLELALAEFPQLAIDKRELARSGPSFMVDTLQELRGVFPRRPLLMLAGQDAVNQLHGWDRWRQLFVFAHVIILSRPGSEARYRGDVAAEIRQRTVQDLQALGGSAAGGVLVLEVGAYDISATSIKAALHAGEPPGHAMPVAELDYILERGLYS